MPRVKVNDTSMYYEAQGEGPPLVMIMGFGGSSAAWDPELIRELSREHKVIIFDNRGTGRSDKPDTEYSMGMMANDAADLMEAINIRKAHVLGVSMGGMIAQEFALRHPEKVISLILCCTTCGGQRGVPIPPDAARGIFPVQGLSPEDIIRQSWRILFTPKFVEENRDKLEETIPRLLKYPTPIFIFRRQGEAIMKHDTFSRLPKIKVPTLVLAGEEDALIPPENSKILAKRIPNAQIFIAKNAGHGFLQEARDHVVPKILDFLKGHSTRNS